MSIDANVIIFERIREEIDKGKAPKSAIQSGYDRALSAIIDANVTTVIAALVLYQFGTGPIKRFCNSFILGNTDKYVYRNICYSHCFKHLYIIEKCKDSKYLI